MSIRPRRTPNPLPLNPFDIATVSQVRASRQFRITLDTNRYSVPAHLAGQTLTLKTYPDRLCLYYQNQLVARHPRRYDRHGSGQVAAQDAPTGGGSQGTIY